MCLLQLFAMNLLTCEWFYCCLKYTSWILLKCWKAYILGYIFAILCVSLCHVSQCWFHWTVLGIVDVSMYCALSHLYQIVTVLVASCKMSRWCPNYLHVWLNYVTMRATSLLDENGLDTMRSEVRFHWHNWVQEAPLSDILLKDVLIVKRSTGQSTRFWSLAPFLQVPELPFHVMRYCFSIFYVQVSC